MSNAESAAAGTPQSQMAPQDTQTLMTLLGNLVPLLLRMQSQMAPGPFFQQGPVAFAPVNPLVDQQAAINLVEDMIADSLRTLTAYLETHAGKYPALTSSAPIVSQARHCLAARDYAQAFELIWQAYRLVTALRASNPQLPALRSAEFGASSSQAGGEARVH